MLSDCPNSWLTASLLSLGPSRPGESRNRQVMAAVGKGHLCFAFGLLFNASWGMSIWCFFQAIILYYICNTSGASSRPGPGEGVTTWGVSRARACNVLECNVVQQIKARSRDETPSDDIPVRARGMYLVMCMALPCAHDTGACFANTCSSALAPLAAVILCICVCMCVCVYIYIYIYNMYVYIYIYNNINTIIM